MSKITTRNLTGITKSFIYNISGGMAVPGAIATLVVVTASGAALEYTNKSRVSSAMQQVVDAAALGGAGASDKKDEQIAKAKEILAAHGIESFGMKVEDPEATPQRVFHNDKGHLVVQADAGVEAGLLGLFGMEKLSVQVEAIANRQGVNRVPICFMAMHPTRKHTLELKKSVSLYGPDCNIYGNSNHPYDVVDPHTPENFVVSASIQAIGYGHHYLENLTPPLVKAEELIPDPYATLTLPKGACESDKQSVSISSGKTQLDPGIYCGGFEVSGGAEVTLNPGVYVFKDSGGSSTKKKIYYSNINI